MWYSFGTNQNRDIHVQIATSSDFDTWAVISGTDALPNLPGWVNPLDPAVWAPDVIKNVRLLRITPCGTWSLLTFLPGGRWQIRALL